MTYRPSNSDDIIYGDLGKDFLRGGVGDHLVFGAEALVKSYIGYLERNNPRPGRRRTVRRRATVQPRQCAGVQRPLRRELGAYQEFASMMRIVLPGNRLYFPNFDAGETGPQAPTAQTRRSTPMETTARSATSATTGSLPARARITPLADGATTL